MAKVIKARAEIRAQPDGSRAPVGYTRQTLEHMTAHPLIMMNGDDADFKKRYLERIANAMKAKTDEAFAAALGLDVIANGAKLTDTERAVWYRHRVKHCRQVFESLAKGYALRGTPPSGHDELIFRAKLTAEQRAELDRRDKETLVIAKAKFVFALITLFEPAFSDANKAIRQAVEYTQAVVKAWWEMQGWELKSYAVTDPPGSKKPPDFQRNESTQILDCAGALGYDLDAQCGSDVRELSLQWDEFPEEPQVACVDYRRMGHETMPHVQFRMHMTTLLRSWKAGKASDGGVAIELDAYIPDLAKERFVAWWTAVCNADPTNRPTSVLSAYLTWSLLDRTNYAEALKEQHAKEKALRTEPEYIKMMKARNKLQQDA